MGVLMLEKGTVSLVFGEGMDTKTDEVDVMPTKLLNAENIVFNKNNALSKVDGYKLLSSDIYYRSTDPNPYPAASTINNPSMLVSYNDELLCCSSTQLFGYVPNNDSWISKGSYSNISFENKEIVYLANHEKEASRYAKCGDFEWITYFAGAYGGTHTEIRNCLYHKDINLIFDEYLQDGKSNLALLKFNNSIWALSTQSDHSVLATRYSFTDMYSYSTQLTVSGLICKVGSGTSIFDYIIDEENNICIIAWYDDVAGKINIAQFLDNGTISGKVDVFIGSMSNVYDIRLFHSKYETTKHYILGFVYEDATTSYYKAAVYDTSLAEVVSCKTVTSSVYSNNGYYFNYIDIIPDSQYSWRFYYTKIRSVHALDVDLLNNGIFYYTMDIFGTLSVSAILCKVGATIAGKAINDTNCTISGYPYFGGYNNFYLIAAYVEDSTQTAQSSYYFLDAINTNPVGKIISAASFSDGGLKIIPFNNTFLITYSNQTFGAAEFGVRKFDTYFGKIKSKSEINNTLYLSGPILYEYDGTYTKENNFLVYPESLGASTTKSSAVVTQQGTVSTHEISQITFSDAQYLNVTHSAATTTYIKFYTANNANAYVIWFNKTDVNGNSLGVASSASGTLIQVNIDHVLSADNVAYCVYSVLQGMAGITVTIPYSNVVQIENTSNGAVTDIAFNLNTFTAAGPANGTYEYTAIYEWLDKFGNVHRSAPATPISVVVSTAPSPVFISIPYLHITAKSEVYIKVYRTEASGTTFYLLVDPSSILYYPNDTKKSYCVFKDYFTDAQITSNEILYTDGGILENIALDANKYICSYKNRLVSSGFVEENKIIYSKPLETNVGMSLNDQLIIQCDSLGGSIIAQTTLDDKLIIFKENNIFYVVGEGANAAGANQTYINPQLITSDVGCAEPNSIVLTPNGLMFKSAKGIYLLDRSLQPHYIGWEVEKFNDQEITSAILIEDHNQVRFTTRDSMCLVYDYFVKQWTTFTNHQAIDACIWDGLYCHLDTDGVKVETRDIFEFNGVGYPMSAETAWIKLDGVQNFQRCYRANILAKFKSDHILYIRVFYDYDNVNFDEYSFNTSNLDEVVPISQDSEVYQVQIHLKRQKCQAIKFKFFDNALDEGLSLTDLTLMIGKKRGINKVPANKKI